MTTRDRTRLIDLLLFFCTYLHKAFWKSSNYKAISILKNGGTMVYSTCSIFKEENEENITYLLNKYPNIHLEQISKELIGGHIDFLPTKYEQTLCVKPNNYYEGFYIAKLVKS